MELFAAQGRPRVIAPTEFAVRSRLKMPHIIPANRPPRIINVTTTLSHEEYEQLLAWIDERPNPEPTRAAALRTFVLAGLGILEQP
jgi:hypothetical protein